MIADWYDDGRVDKIYPLALLSRGDQEPAARRPRLLEREGRDRARARVREAGQARPGRQRPDPAGDDRHDRRPRRPTTDTTETGTTETDTTDDATPTRRTDTTDGDRARPTPPGPSSVPVPLLVLGGLAVLLLAAGSAGYLRRRMNGDGDGDGTPPAAAVDDRRAR